MKAFVVALAFLFATAPGLACAQAEQGGGPPADMSAKMEQARSDSKTASFNALSPDHRVKVQAIVDRFDAGTLTDPRDAAAQIDAVLTPAETTAVLAQRQTMRSAMEASMRPDGANPGMGGSPGMGGPSAMGGPPGPHNAADAGRFLLTVAADREKLRDAMRAQRDRAPQ